MHIVVILLIIFAAALVPIFSARGLPDNLDILPIRTATPSTPTPTPVAISIPSSKLLNTNYHVFQSFNNCGPAALSMALRFYNIVVSQQELGNALRPYQNPQGDNDDKSTTLAEMAEKAKDYGLIPYHRPLGNAELVKQFIAADIPVITRTWLKPADDIGHYRVVKGYEESTKEFIQDDSLQGKNLRYTYSEFNVLWEKFSYEYLVLVPPEKDSRARQILGINSDPKAAWQSAVKYAEDQLLKEPNNIYVRFNLSVALYYVGNYQRSVTEFEKIEAQLPFRTLWYQIEPIQAYYELGNYDRVFSITEKILNNHNRAFSELYVIRGDIYRKQNNNDRAREEYAKAVEYNRSFADKVPVI